MPMEKTVPTSHANCLIQNSQAEHLILTKHYPSCDDLDRNGFIHARARAYRAKGVRFDVFRLRPDEPVSNHDFEDVNVVSGSQELLYLLLSSGRYKTVLVHFLDSSMWDVLQHYIASVKVVVWIHGVDIQPWRRRDFDHQTDEERIVARRKSDERMVFWRELLQPAPNNLKLVFVSRYSAEAAMEDLGFRIPETHYSIIHNPIETDIFRYEPKGVDQRKKVLSIRPYASRGYANDLTVRAIELLSKKPWFSEFEFRIIGDGPLFEETVAPLRNYKNVYIEQRFPNPQETVALHKEYGIFLCPTRMDTQGTSRDEAMSSGLVPVTNAVAAIPEFVDHSCGILAPGEDAEAMARGITLLYEQPLKFSAMSKAAAKRIQEQRDTQRGICAELVIILEGSELRTFIDALVRSTHFLAKEDHSVFEACESAYRKLYAVTGDSGHLLALCSLYFRRYKRAAPEVIDVALEALKHGGHPDAATYYGKAVICNLTATDALMRLSEAKELLSDKKISYFKKMIDKKLMSQMKNSCDILKIFEACIFWKTGDMGGYTSSLKEFFESKNKDFNPYVSIPASTAWLHSYAPSVSNCDKEKAPFNYVTVQPSYEPSYIISVSCDSGYFAKYGNIFFKSLATIQDNFYCHISILDQVDARVPDRRFVLVNQNIGTQANVGPFASGLRYLHAHELLTSNSCPVIVMDFDSAVRKSLEPLLEECGNVDAGLRVLSNVLPWEEITAGLSIFNQTEKAKFFLSTVSGYLLNTLKLDVQQWWIDQNALECAARFSKKNGFVHMNLFKTLPPYVVIPTGSYESKIAQLKAAI